MWHNMFPFMSVINNYVFFLLFAHDTVILIAIVIAILFVVLAGLICIAVCKRRGGEPRHTRLPSDDVNAWLDMYELWQS